MMYRSIPSPDIPDIPEAAQQELVNLLSGKYLGASRTIRRINDLFVLIAENMSATEPQAIVDSLLATGEHIIHTRGQNTPAIANSIRLVLKDLEQSSPHTSSEVLTIIKARRDGFNDLSLQNASLIAEYGANLLDNFSVVMPFDYSSSVIAILERLAQRGRKLTLVVLESRCMDGGRAIAREASEMGHQIVFTVDMAFAHHLRQCEAVLVGAETVFAGGDCWNTIGSYPIAVLSQKFDVPFYVATEMLKIDMNSFIGAQRQLQPLDFGRLLGYPAGFSNPEQISVTDFDLEVVPAPLITAYITPRGVMPPAQVWSTARQFLRDLNVDVP